MFNNNHLAAIKKFGKENDTIAAIYLFGSYAQGKEKKKSDVDIALLCFTPLDGFARIEMETGLSVVINKDVDLIDMKKASPLLRHQVYKYGKIIYSKEKHFPARFRAFSIKEYLDTLYLYEQREKIING